MGEEIVFVTHNTGKIKSAEKYFKNLKFTIFNRENRKKTDGSMDAMQEFAKWYEKLKE